MKSLAYIVSFVFSVSFLAFVSCSSSEKPSNDKRFVKACTLLSAEDVKSIVGLEIASPEAKELKSPSGEVANSMCQFNSVSETESLSLNLMVSSNPSQLSPAEAVVKRFKDLGTSLGNEVKYELLPEVGPGAAFSADTSQVMVFTGKYIVILTLFQKEKAKLKQNLVAVTQKVMAKM